MEMNTTVLMQRRVGTLIPAEPKANKLLDRIPAGERIAVRILRGRSALQNRMYWQVLERVVEATGRWRTADELHAALKVATGHIETIELINGRRVLVPDSIRFEHMSQDEAQVYYDAAYRILCDEIFNGITVEELLNPPEAA